MQEGDATETSGPPADAEAWTDEQWIDWLKATDRGDVSVGEMAPCTASGRIVHSAGGQVLGQAMVGLANAIFGQKDDKVVIVAEANGQPELDEPFTVNLDPDHPEQSSVIFNTPRTTSS